MAIIYLSSSHLYVTLTWLKKQIWGKVEIVFEKLFLKRCVVFQSIVTVGAAAGGLLGGWMVEKIGRKLSLMFCSLPFVFGFTIIIAAQNVWMLYLGRVLTGLASGVTSLVVPVRNLFITVSSSLLTLTCAWLSLLPLLMFVL